MNEQTNEGTQWKGKRRKTRKKERKKERKIEARNCDHFSIWPMFYCFFFVSIRLFIAQMIPVELTREHITLDAESAKAPKTKNQNRNMVR